MTRTGAILAAALVAAVALPARAEPTGRIVVHRSTYIPGDATGIVPLPLVHAAGNILELTNLDPLLAHSVTSDAFKPGSLYERLFDSGPVDFRGQAPVTGVESLPPGTYTFFCALHGEMRGALDVVG